MLWEWAFTILDIDIDSDNNDGVDLPQRSREEEDIEQKELFVRLTRYQSVRNRLACK